jgi:hypothetical protein
VNRSALLAAAGLLLSPERDVRVDPQRAKRWPSFSSTIATPIATRMPFHDAHPHGDLRWTPAQELWTAPKQAGDQRNDKQHEEYEEQELGDFGCANGVPPKPNSAATSAITKNTAA